MKLRVIVSKYQNNDNLALLLETEIGEPYARLSTNIDSLPDNWCAIDTNNFPKGEELIEKNGLGFKVGEIGSGFCMYPIYEIDTNSLNGKIVELGE